MLPSLCMAPPELLFMAMLSTPLVGSLLTPSAIGCYQFGFNLNPPEESRTLHHRLTFKHRSSTEITIFIIHFLRYYSKKNMYDTKTIGSSADVPLAMSTFPSGILPLLVEISCDIDDEIVLNTIEQEFIKDLSDIVLISDYRLYDSQTRLKNVKNFCHRKNWKLNDNEGMMGIEANVVIIFYCDKYFDIPELISRARLSLIIVQK